MINRSRNYYPQIWGGLECTINRVNDSFYDQLSYSNHYVHDEDIHHLVSLGITAMRYPVLWERHQPEKDQVINWSWISTQLNYLRKHGIDPIAGLLHHGSGPLFTNLEDKNFPFLFAAYAHKVARQFPWLKYYTPINEPLTTARFSGLYGHWYPHKKNDLSFCRMFLNEIKAVILAMKAIRKINAEAELIQTEDLGQTFSTPTLQYQADFENLRRWLPFDILNGNFGPTHPLHDYFLWADVSEEELSFFYEENCPPNVLGINYYVTSERFLDEKWESYPENFHGGNHIHQYADVEAIRVKHGFKSGVSSLACQVAERYSIPIAITEVHMHCHREHQLRWLTEIWKECVDINSSGGNVIAVTPWSLLGSFGWNKLLTLPHGDYECGVFDLRGAKRLRPTALVSCISSLSTTGHYNHPVLKEPGWWHQSNRYYNSSLKNKTYPHKEGILIIGKTGTLGNAFARICSERFLPYQVYGRDIVDISSPDQIEMIINSIQPWAIINTAGFVKVDEAETQEDECFDCNSFGASYLAAACEQHGIKLLTFSTDLVFDGNKKSPYLENDTTNPLNNYGKSKELAEQMVVSKNNSALIIRTSAFFSAWDKYNFVYWVLENLKAGKSMPVLSDVMISPTHVPDLVHVALDLLIDKEEGIWHLSNQGEITWSDLAIEVCNRARLNRNLIEPRTQSELNLKALRPGYSVLSSEKAQLMPPLEAALNSFFSDYRNRSNNTSVSIQPDLLFTETTR